MARLANYVYRVDTGEPFKTGSATILGPDGSTLSTPALDGTTGRWIYQANGQPGKTKQTYNADGQYKVINGDAYGQAGYTMEGEIDEILKLFGDGVLTGMGLTAPGSMQVQVGIGSGLNLGVFHPIYTAENVTIETADGSNPRIDRIVSRLTRTGTFAGRVVLGVVKGTAAASPTAPALTNDADTNEWEIGRVTLSAGASSVTSGMLSIANKSVATGPVAPSSVGTTELEDGSVTTPKYADASITLAKIASGVLQPSLTPGLLASYWLHPLMAVGGTVVQNLSLSANTLYGSPIYIAQPTTVNRLAFYISAIVGSAAMRIGLYKAASDGRLGALVVDAGTATYSTIGTKEATVSAAVQAGWYWIVFATSAITLLYQNYITSARPIFGAPTAVDITGYSFLQGSHTAANPLPDPGPSMSVSATGILFYARTAGS